MEEELDEDVFTQLLSASAFMIQAFFNLCTYLNSSTFFSGSATSSDFFCS